MSILKLITENKEGVITKEDIAKIGADEIQAICIRKISDATLDIFMGTALNNKNIVASAMIDLALYTSLYGASYAISRDLIDEIKLKTD